MYQILTTNIMNKGIRLLIVFLSVWTINLSLPASAQTTNRTQKLRLRYSGSTSSSTPRVPSDYELSCLYEDGELYFSFPEGTLSIEVAVRNESNGITNRATLYSEAEGIALPGSATAYYIACQTDQGVTFTGHLTF